MYTTGQLHDLSAALNHAADLVDAMGANHVNERGDGESEDIAEVLRNLRDRVLDEITFLHRVEAKSKL